MVFIRRQKSERHAEGAKEENKPQKKNNRNSKAKEGCGSPRFTSTIALEVTHFLGRAQQMGAVHSGHGGTGRPLLPASATQDRRDRWLSAFNFTSSKESNHVLHFHSASLMEGFCFSFTNGVICVAEVGSSM